MFTYSNSRVFHGFFCTHIQKIPKYKQITRKQAIKIAKDKGIKEPRKMSTRHLINAIDRHTSKTESYANRRKVRKKGLNKYVKIQNISENDLRKVTKLQNMSHDDLKTIAILQNIKNHDKLSREDLVYALLKPESHPVESNYIKYNISDEIKGKIKNIRIALARLGEIVTKNERKKIKKDLYEIEKKRKTYKNTKKRAYRYLIELANALDRKEENKHNDQDDLDYFGIKGIENLFANIDDADFYKPQLVRSSFKKNYEYYEIRGDKDKKLSIQQYLYMIIPYLTELINEKKNNSIEHKIQLSMSVNFMCIADKEKTRTFHVKSDNVEIRLSNDTSEIIKELINSFLSNYQKEEQILRNGSNYVFKIVNI